MTINNADLSRASQEQWLKLYYFSRTAFSAVWVAAAFTVGQHAWAIAAVLLVAYPAWDALANFVDASRSGGLGQNRPQAINVMVSVVTTLAVVLALAMSMNWVLGVFGVWAILSGLLAGTFFIVQARMPMPPSITNVAGYAAVGAFYFLVSAVWLGVSQSRRKAA
jgi:hypothetical protein